MYLENEIWRLLQQLNQQINWQTHQLQVILNAVQSLEKEVQALKAIRQPTIDKVEYNFDQLKVEKLEGTLNVGLTPGALGQDGQYAVNGQNLEDLDIQQSAPVPAFGISERLNSRVQEYLNEDAETEIVACEQKYQYKLGENFRKVMLDDLRKQMDQRIHHYLQASPEFNSNVDKENWAYDKVKGDIQIAIHNYFERVHPMKQEGGNP